MPKVIVTKSGPRLMRVHLDGKRIKFEGRDTSECEVPSGEHALQWFVQGTPGEQYSIELACPGEDRFKHTDRLDASMSDAGLKWFQVD